MSGNEKKVQIADSWYKLLEDEFSKEYFSDLKQALKKQITEGVKIYPPGPLIFNAFNTTPVEEVKVVIIGQDPYHGAGQAMGLSFSVPKGVAVPRSLKNIFKEIETDIGLSPPNHGDLTYWASQGVLLLNAALTVQARKANSHKNLGWHTFTDAVIKRLSAKKEHLVFMLWGNFARSKATLIDESRHLVLSSGHPSPFSAEKYFFGNKHFSKANKWLVEHGKQPIDWQLP